MVLAGTRTPQPRMDERDERNSEPRTPAPTVWPTFHARDAPAMIDFLVGTLGFVKTAAYADGDRIATPSSTGRKAVA